MLIVPHDDPDDSPDLDGPADLDEFERADLYGPTVVQEAVRHRYRLRVLVGRSLREAGKVAVIPPKRNRKEPRDYDRELYQARHLIENFFCKLKQYRAIATRYDKTRRNFLAGVYLAATAILLN